MVAAGEALVRNIKGIKKFVKDGDGRLLKDEQGRYVVEVEVEYVDEAGNSSTLHAAAEELTEVVDDLAGFVSKPLSEKLEAINIIWKTKYPVDEMFDGRNLFEDVMGQYRYTKASGWVHTGDISEFFKGIDFYKGTTQGPNIFAETAVSMKTTIISNVDTWLGSAAIQKNIKFLKEGLDPVTGLGSNGKVIFINNAEIHIYMPKENITEALKTQWMNKLNTVDPRIKFEIKTLEDFVN